MGILQKLKIDPFLIMMVAVIGVASLFPCEGSIKVGFQSVTTAAIALLFFMHGAKLSRASIMAGAAHWRLHLCIFLSTFVGFPIIGVLLRIIVPAWLPTELYRGFLYLCLLPATVQSAIAFTSVAKGNVAAAICSASASSLLGVFISPVLVGILMDQGSAHVTDLTSAISAIMWQLMLPFVLGHLSRPGLVYFLEKHQTWVNLTDRSSILLVVYVAFSEAVLEGIWQQVGIGALLTVLGVSATILAVVLVSNRYVARLLGFKKQDEITLVFCGSKKSLANGVPMANVLFPAASVGIILLPLMIFHQLQLMVCAVLAQQYANRTDE